MKRRRALLAAGALLAVRPLFAPAQAPSARKVTVAVLSASTPERGLALSQPFFSRMKELGWIEGRNITYIRAYAEGETGRLDALAAELCARTPDLVFAGVAPAAVAVHKVTKTIPVVFGVVNDPVRLGLVRSLGRPGGNVTGVISVSESLGPKRLQLFAEFLPKLKRVGLLVDTADTGSTADRAPTEQAARTLGIELLVGECRGPQDLQRCVTEVTARGAGALLGSTSAMLYGQSSRVIDLARKARVPFAGGPAGFADIGALFGYSASLGAQFRRAAEFADRILRGAKPADLPVEQMDKFEFRINARTARSLGIAIPQSILLRADRVIE